MMTLRVIHVFTVMAAFLTCITGNIPATDQVPDNQVWTPPTATFFYGQLRSNITCKFLGTPYGVYWMKGSTPATADPLVSSIKGEISGPGSDDGSLTITPEYTLVFNNIQASDAGNYICRVSNHNGFLIVNNTDVRVLDPSQVSIFTEPSVTGWAGSSVSLLCVFIGTPERVLWNRIQGGPESKSVETILRYTSAGYEVLGERRYSWSDTYGLIIRDLHVLDEGNFTCMVSKTGGTEIENTTVLAVNARAERPYLQIPQCKSQPERVTNGTTTKPCLYNVTEDRDSFELQCSVIGAKPEVDILWQEGSRNLTAKTYVTQRTDGAYDVTATITRRMNQSDFTYTCIASGLAVNGTAEQTVIVRRIKVALPISHGIHAVAIIFIVMLVLAIIVLLVFIVFRVKQYQTLHPSYSECPVDNDTTVESGGTDWIGNLCVNKTLISKECVRWVFCGGERDGSITDAEQPLKETKTDLDLLRERMNEYRPGKATGESLGQEPPAINIGLFGVMGAGKSSFINSLKFALSGTYNNVAVGADNTQGGSSTKFRETISLTEHIHVLDNRGMQDFQIKQIEKDLMPQICGERGLKPDEKIKEGKVVHCPVFVCNFSQQTPSKPTLDFLVSFSEKVLDHCGRNVMVVVTHKKTLKEKDEIKNEIHRRTNVPEEYIAVFENFTEDNHGDNEEKSIEYLKFLDKCLDIAERNITFVTERMGEKHKNKWNLLNRI